MTNDRNFFIFVLCVVATFATLPINLLLHLLSLLCNFYILSLGGGIIRINLVSGARNYQQWLTKCVHVWHFFSAVTWENIPENLLPMFFYYSAKSRKRVWGKSFSDISTACFKKPQSIKKLFGSVRDTCSVFLLKLLLCGFSRLFFVSVGDVINMQ